MTNLKTLLITSALLLSTLSTFADDKGSADDKGAGGGTVAETMVSGGYVYVRLAEDDSWLASSPVPVSVGDRVAYASGAMMKDFYSRTLDRTFDSILFVMKLDIDSQTDADTHASAVSGNPQGVATSSAAVAPKAGDIAPLDGGRTVADVLAEYVQLENQQVSLRARVMKISPNILGKNWITLQDGSGTAPDNRLIATSSETVAVGDLVTVTGQVHTNVDLGSGYTYTVLLEEATFSQ